MIAPRTSESDSKICKSKHKAMAMIKSGKCGIQDNKTFLFGSVFIPLRFPTVIPSTQEFLFKREVLDIPHGRS